MAGIAADQPRSLAQRLDALYLQSVFPTEFRTVSRQRDHLLQIMKSSDAHSEDRRRMTDWLIAFDGRFQTVFHETGLFLWLMMSESSEQASSDRIIALQRAEICLQQERMANELKRFIESVHRPE